MIFSHAQLLTPRKIDSVFDATNSTSQQTEKKSMTTITSPEISPILPAQHFLSASYRHLHSHHFFPHDPVVLLANYPTSAHLQQRNAGQPSLRETD
jgi:hypothetical protein